MANRSHPQPISLDAETIAAIGAAVASGGEGGEATVVAAGPPTAVSGTIASGQALSAAIVIDGKASALQIPAAWTAAAITFQGSIDGATFGDIYDGATERTFASAQVVAGRMLALNMADWLGFKAIRIRSGTAASPVNQAAARTLTVGLAG